MKNAGADKSKQDIKDTFFLRKCKNDLQMVEAKILLISFFIQLLIFLGAVIPCNTFKIRINYSCPVDEGDICR